MRTVYKNKVFQHILNCPIGISNFQLIEGGKEQNELTIKYKDSNFIFVIRQNSSNFHNFDYTFTQYAPQFPMSGVSPDWVGIDDILEKLDYWFEHDLKDYIEDENVPDLWNEFKSGNRTLNFDKIDFNDKERFSNDERTQIKLSLNELKLLIHKTFDITLEEQKIVSERIDYLIEASNRLNKFDWKSLVISSIISITIALTLDPTKGQVLFDLLKKVFSNIPLLRL